MRNDFTTTKFIRGFLCELRVREHSQIGVYEEYRRAWYACWREMVRIVDSTNSDTDWDYSLIRIRNALRPSNNGAFDSIRDLLTQQTLTLLTPIWMATPPCYEIVSPKVYMQAMLDRYSQAEIGLLSGLVDIYESHLNRT